MTQEDSAAPQTLSSSLTNSVFDGLRAYHRSQTLVVPSSYVASSSTFTASFDDEESILEEGTRQETEDENFDGPSIDDDRTPLVGDFTWDEAVYQPRQSPTTPPRPNPRLYSSAPRSYHATPPSIHVPAQVSPIPAPHEEETPLLQKGISFTSPPVPDRSHSFATGTRPEIIARRPSLASSLHPRNIARRDSFESTKGFVLSGSSTFGQTLFNSIAILLGIGMLSEPLAFAYAGWIGGSVLIVFYGFITCYTAKILAKIILSDPRLRTYADIGRRAFGPRSVPLTSTLFALELFSLSVVLITLFADSLHSVVPSHSKTTYKLVSLLILIPTVHLPLSFLAYTSIIGIVSTILILFVVFFDGFSKQTSPGSLISPAPTDLAPYSVETLGVAFGLMMAGFSGHAVIPSLAKDMRDPRQFDKMIEWAFIVATIIYGILGAAGYLMFGHAISDEVSQDLLHTVGYNPTLNKVLMWMLVIMPISKFALGTRPLSVTIEILLGIETLAHVEHTGPSPPRSTWKTIFRVLTRSLLAVFAVIVSILIPDFSSMMAFLGSFSAFMICVIGPVSAKIMLEGGWKKAKLWDLLLLLIAVVMAVWGTVVAFMQ